MLRLLLYKAYYSQHTACPFGATACVHAWERIGNTLAHLARKLLHLPVLRYVDDYVSPERPKWLSHSMRCFVRLARLLLGPDSIAESKMEFGKDLCVLGVDFRIRKHSFTCRPAGEEVCLSVLVPLCCSASSSVLCRPSAGLKLWSKYQRQSICHRGQPVNWSVSWHGGARTSLTASAAPC